MLITPPKVVLFVDDDPDDLELLEEATGFIDPFIKRLTATNGEEALALLSDRNASIPDLIFLDINMPIMNGIECLAELKKIEKLSNIPIIICSTSLYINNKQQYEALGADFYLVKPDTLVKTINSLQFVFERSYLKVANKYSSEQLIA